MAVDTRVEEFRRAAASFRRTIEEPEPGESAVFARSARNAVARAYLAAVFLPAGEITPDAPAEVDAVPREVGLERRLAETLGPGGDALTTEPLEVDDELGHALALLESAAPEALWDVRFAFESHWGSRAVNVLRTLHRLANRR